MNDVLRQEKKFAINLTDGAILRQRLGSVMHRDAHNGAQGYVIRSLYFDTPDDQDFQDKIDGLELRRKIRLRTYSPQSSFAMLEMKQKQGPYQRKRSLRIAREDAQHHSGRKLTCVSRSGRRARRFRWTIGSPCLSSRSTSLNPSS